ncbi:MAG: 3D domain-containing protein [Solidesulfovibrio sp. DCME]|uniref:3D domain-containing protein n=1 Tax=Solidesulfovibrio sp. DCME TaxID=3447380 RepID=UPI003D0E5139
MEQPNNAPSPGGKRAPLLSVALAGLALSAVALSHGTVMVRQRLAALRHDAARLAQEAVMRQEGEKRLASLFTLDEDQRRRFTLTATAYCPLCGSEDGQPQPTARGGVVRPGRTVAVSRDLKHLLGRRVLVEGLGVRVVEDLMHPRFTDRLDLCLPDKEQALAFGVKRLELVVLD